MLKPKCLLNTALRANNPQGIGHSAQGYLLPCCFIDAFPKIRGIAQDIFYQEKLKISNNDNITDIIQSKEWIDFYTLLQEEPDKAPPVCYRKCDSNSSRGDVYDVNK